MLDTTIPGGCYLAADGISYVDANGQPVSPENVEKFLALRSVVEDAGPTNAESEPAKSTTKAKK